MFGPVAGNPLKRCRELSGLDDEGLGRADPPSKKSKTFLNHIIQKNSTSSVRTIVRDVVPHPKPGRFLQAGTLASLPTRAEAARVSALKVKGVMFNHRKMTEINRFDFPIGIGQGVTLSITVPLATTLSGTVKSQEPNVPIKPVFMRDDTVFEIHADTADEEMENLLTHSANSLDIADDETRIAAKSDRGNENVPPTDGIYAVGTAIRAARTNTMTKKPRKPLGELKIAELPAETGW